MKIPKSCSVAESAVIVGDFELGENVSVWHGAVIRAEKSIKIGKNTNVQDGAIIHADKNDVIIGENCTIGHNAVVDDSSVGSNCLIGMNSSVFDSEIGDYTLVAAGAVVNKMKIGGGVLVAGVPAEIKKELEEKHREEIKRAYKQYLKKITSSREARPQSD